MYRNIIDTLTSLGHTIIWAANFSEFIGDIKSIPCKTENIKVRTNPFNINNIKAYNQLLQIIDKYKVEAVLCNTPIGGLLGRVCAYRKKIRPVIYTAHGFLHFKGAPLINRTLYKWMEQFLAHYTDELITITNEDYQSALTFNLREQHSPYMIHGAGVNIGLTPNINVESKRAELGISRDAFVIISAGELNRNKNTKVMVNALSYLKDMDVHYIACGAGNEEKKLIKLAKKMGVSTNFHLLGYRTDVGDLMHISNAFVMMSYREGLPRSIMEAMDLKLPCIGSDTRGIRDLIDVNKGGFICNPDSPKDFANAIRYLADNPTICVKMGLYNKEKVSQYSSEIVKNELLEIYSSILNSESYANND